MAETTTISWTHHTFNGHIGCTKVADGCTFCYAEADMANAKGRVVWGPKGTRSRTSDDYWKQPIKWNKQAEAAGERRRVFCCSLADVFEDWKAPIVDHRDRRLFLSPGRTYCTKEDGSPVSHDGWRPATMDNLRADLFSLIDQTPNLDWLLLTKRPENVRRMWKPVAGRARCASFPDCNHPDCQGAGIYRRCCG